MAFNEITIQPFAGLGRILLYAQDVEAVTAFYTRHFGFQISREAGDRIVEFESTGGKGPNIVLHSAGKGRKQGQTLTKLIFDCADVEAFVIEAKRNGLDFGGFHKGEGYRFVNAKDSSGTSVFILSRIFRNDIFR